MLKNELEKTFCTHCIRSDCSDIEAFHYDWHLLVNLIQTTGTDLQKNTLEQLQCLLKPRKIDTNSSNY